MYDNIFFSDSKISINPNTEKKLKLSRFNAYSIRTIKNNYYIFFNASFEMRLVKQRLYLSALWPG